MTTAGGDNSTQIKPLSKRKVDTEELYSRRAEVERQIGKTITFTSKEISDLLSNKDRNSAGYVFDETLVYLLREARIQNDDLAIESLYPELNRRIWRLLRKFYKYFREQADFEDFGQKVEMGIIEKILNVALDCADYAQVNFGDFVMTQANTAWRGNLSRIKKEQDLFHSERNDEKDEGTPEIQFESKDISPEEKLILREGIGNLPDHIRDVAVLILDGWQIESKVETQPTISKFYNVSSRTIRNWLKEARDILAGYEGEIR